MRRITSLVAIAAAFAMTAGCRSRTRRICRPRRSDRRLERRRRHSGRRSHRRRGARLARRFSPDVPSDRVFFALDSYSLDAEDRRTLDAQADWLRRNPNVPVTIEGHADERGTREYNLALGDRRANAARDYLQSRGVEPSRMQTISYGKERPAVEGSNEAAWAQNRRAVTVVPE